LSQAFSRQHRLDLILFADSSQLAYGTVAYLSWRTRTHRITRLVAAKAKPFPKSPPLLTIPRGELLACLLSVKLKDNLVKHLGYPFRRIIFITDSSIVLGQIALDNCRFKPWVSTRLEEICEHSNISEWYHIGSKLNIADVITRGVNPDELGLSSIWQNGHDWMKTLNIDLWPLKPGMEFTSMDCSSKAELRIKDPRMNIPGLIQRHAIDKFVIL
jgi:hypothetical protein